jgi:hypothetical protein
VSDGLFDMEPVVVPPDTRTAGEKRRDRIAAAIAVGTHPLGLVFPGLRVNPNPELTCGNCRFRAPVHGGARSYPKCLRDYSETEIPPAARRRYGPTKRISMPYVTHGEATDVRAGWPACQFHQPKETE